MKRTGREGPGTLESGGRNDVGPPTGSQFSVRSRPVSGFGWLLGCFGRPVGGSGGAGFLHRPGASFWWVVAWFCSAAGGFARGLWAALGLLLGGLGVRGRLPKTWAVLGRWFGCRLGGCSGSFGGPLVVGFWVVFGFCRVRLRVAGWWPLPCSTCLYFLGCPLAGSPFETDVTFGLRCEREREREREQA